MEDDDRKFAALCEKMGWYAYGGDEALYAALKGFLGLCMPPTTANSPMYDYREVSQAVGGAAAWLLIYAFVRLGWVNYGTSPRFGWLEEEGLWLREYVATRTPEQLADVHQAADELACKGEL